MFVVSPSSPVNKEGRERRTEPVSGMPLTQGGVEAEDGPPRRGFCIESGPKMLVVRERDGETGVLPLPKDDDTQGPPESWGTTKGIT